MTPLVPQPGVRLYPGALDRDAQQKLVAEIGGVIRAAPLFRPTMPRTGKEYSVRMTNCGPLGWTSDQNGYRYQDQHPTTGNPWPAMPDSLLQIWRDLAEYPADPDACLVNFYDRDAKLGIHQDRDEQDFSAPIISISLGDSCRFRFGGNERNSPTRSIILNSGDIVIFGGPSRKMFHAVDRIMPSTSTLLNDQLGRINLTMRRAR